MDPSPLCVLGHVATRRDLETSGVSRQELRALLEAGAIARPRKGVYACPHLTGDERIAVLVGARLDCVTVLRRHKIWIGHASGLHLRMPGEAGGHASQRLKACLDLHPGSALRPHARAHWSRGTAAELGSRLEVPVADALHQAMGCLPPDDLLGALESALHLREITGSELDRLVIGAPERLQPALMRLTPGAQSGYETKARLKLQRAGHRVEIQMPVPGVGKVDTLVDGVVVLEIDGRETHAQTFEADRDRDLGTEMWGLRVLRVPAVWVDSRWDEVLSAIERMIAGAVKARELRVRRTSHRRRRIRAEIFDDTPPAE